MFGLQPLIDPLTVDEFASRYHGRRAVIIQGRPEKFDGVCGWSDISHLLNHGGLHYPGAQFVLNREPLAAEALQHADHWLKQGATLIINGIQRLDPVIEHFSSGLSRDMNAAININCYTSWPSKQGFDNHFDRHDVFVLQVEGEKTWRVFEPTQTYPLELDKSPRGEPPQGEPYLECHMTPGDVMYIPRGHWHYALAQTPSVHLTVGPVSRSGIDFLAWLTHNVLLKDEFLRRDFPLMDNALLGGELDDSVLLEHVAGFKEAIEEMLDDDTLTSHLIRYCMTTNPIRRYCPLPAYVTLPEEWDRDTRFQVNPNQKALVQYDPEDRRALVLVRGHVLNLEEIPEELVKRLFDTPGPMSGRELQEGCADIKWKRLRRFLLRLFETGVIVQAEDSP